MIIILLDGLIFIVITQVSYLSKGQMSSYHKAANRGVTLVFIS